METMAMNDALRFISRVRGDTAFREEAYKAGDPRRFAVWVENSGYRFSSAEIDDAFRVLLLKAADEEAAEEIKEIRQWYALQSGYGG
jgi:predicted ribosomally synthesized peptide with nif11-like leader